MRIEDVIAHWVTEGRVASLMTQEQLGERLGQLLGKPWTKQAVSAAEKGRRSFTAAELIAFAVALGCNVENLLQPPMDVDDVTLSDGPPLKSSDVRTIAAPSTDLADLVANMEHLRQLLMAIRNTASDTEALGASAQTALAQTYHDLRRLMTV